MSTPAMELTPEAPVALYRMFAADDALLYVGITIGPASRFRQHAASKAWWPQVARMTVAWYSARNDAMRAEYDAVRDERPLHNVATPALPLPALPERPKILSSSIRVRAGELRARAAQDGLSSDQALAGHLGMRAATLSHAFSGRASAGERLIAKVLAAFRDTSFEDLFEISVTTASP